MKPYVGMKYVFVAAEIQSYTKQHVSITESNKRSDAARNIIHTRVDPSSTPSQLFFFMSVALFAAWGQEVTFVDKNADNSV